MKIVSENGLRRIRKTVSVFLAVLMFMNLAGAAAEDGQTLLDEIRKVLERTPAEESVATPAPANVPAEALAPIPPEVPAEVPAKAPAQEMPESTETPPDAQTPDAAKPGEAIAVSGVLRIGSVYQTTLYDTQILSLIIPAKADLLLQAGGVPALVRVIEAGNGWQWNVQTPATGDAARPETVSSVTLSRGKYFVVLEPLRAGRVSVCFALAGRQAPAPDTDTGSAAGKGTKDTYTPEDTGSGPDTAVKTSAGREMPAAAAEEQAADEPEAEKKDGGSGPAVPEAIPAETSGEASAPEEAPEGEEAAEAADGGINDDDPAAEAAGDEEQDSGEPEAAETDAFEETADGTAGDAGNRAEAAEAGEAPAEEEAPLPEDAGQAEAETAPDVETAPAPLSVSITVSCDGPFEPGALITLHAQVSDDSRQGVIRWQYSADGGQTVLDVEGAEGPEYSFFLDENNRNWWWRAYLK